MMMIMMMIGKCQEFDLQPARAGPINLWLAGNMLRVTCGDICNEKYLPG
jgi:hypothetical protein